MNLFVKRHFFGKKISFSIGKNDLSSCKRTYKRIINMHLKNTFLKLERRWNQNEKFKYFEIVKSFTRICTVRRVKKLNLYSRFKKIIFASVIAHRKRELVLLIQLNLKLHIFCTLSYHYLALGTINVYGIHWLIFTKNKNIEKI